MENVNDLLTRVNASWPGIAPAGRFMLQDVRQDNVVMFPRMDMSLHPVHGALAHPALVGVERLPLGLCVFLWFAMAGLCWLAVTWAIRAL